MPAWCDKVFAVVKPSWLCAQAFDLGVQELHLQSWGDNVQKLSSVAFDLAGINPKQVVVKLPCTLEGIETAALLRDANIRVTITGLNSSAQVQPGPAGGRGGWHPRPEQQRTGTAWASRRKGRVAPSA